MIAAIQEPAVKPAEKIMIGLCADIMEEFREGHAHPNNCFDKLDGLIAVAAEIGLEHLKTLEFDVAGAVRADVRIRIEAARQAKTPDGISEKTLLGLGESLVTASSILTQVADILNRAGGAPAEMMEVTLSTRQREAIARVVSASDDEKGYHDEDWAEARAVLVKVSSRVGGEK